MRKENYLRVFVKCLFLLAIVATPLVAQSKKDRDQAKKFQDDADKAIGAKNFKEAADLYGKSVALVPTNNYAHYRKGFAHFSLKEYDQAVTEFTLALDQGFKPRVEIYRIRYSIYFEQGNYDAALADIQRGLEVTPNDLYLLNAVGEVNYARKSYPEALAAFTKASQIPSNNNSDIYYNLARVAYAMGDAKAQAAAAETALAKGPHFPGETFFLLGDANQKLKNPSGAIDAYQKALGAKPGIYQAYQNLGEVFRSESRFAEAVEILKKGLLQFPVDDLFYSQLGLYYSLAGRPADAIEAAQSGIKISPTQPVGYTNLCRAYNETKKYDQAVSASNYCPRLRTVDCETCHIRSADEVGL